MTTLPKEANPQHDSRDQEEKLAEEICKEAYFDMTVHPSENPPLGKFMDEYVSNIEKRIAQALHATRQEALEEGKEMAVKAYENPVCADRCIGGLDKDCLCCVQRFRSGRSVLAPKSEV